MCAAYRNDIFDLISDESLDYYVDFFTNEVESVEKGIIYHRKRLKKWWNFWRRTEIKNHSEYLEKVRLPKAKHELKEHLAEQDRRKSLKKSG